MVPTAHEAFFPILCAFKWKEIGTESRGAALVPFRGTFSVRGSRFDLSMAYVNLSADCVIPTSLSGRQGESGAEEEQNRLLWSSLPVRRQPNS